MDLDGAGTTHPPQLRQMTIKWWGIMIGMIAERNKDSVGLVCLWFRNKNIEIAHAARLVPFGLLKREMQRSFEQHWHDGFFVERTKYCLELLSKIGLAFQVFLVSDQEAVGNVALPLLVTKTRPHRWQKRLLV